MSCKECMYSKRLAAGYLYCEKSHHTCPDLFSCSNFEQRKTVTTNYNRIRNKTPEELGKALASLIWHWKCCDTEADTAQDLIDWLYKEAEK